MPESTCIGPHVWLAHDVLVMKGVEIGAGSVVGARSLVSRTLPARALAVGSPAKVVRTGVSWSRHPYPPAQEMTEIASRVYMRADPPI
jgi:serine acetyltransferase